MLRSERLQWLQKNGSKLMSRLGGEPSRSSRVHDDPPVPPGELIMLVAASNDAEWFLQSGRLGADAVRDILTRNAIALENFDAILDFGCGVGRVLRHLRDVRGPRFFGSDYNPTLIRWCRKNLPFAQFDVNKLRGKLRYKAGTFDFIYVFSIFTHLAEPAQMFWMGEFARVLKPGGYLLLSTHGEAFTSHIPEPLLPRFRNGEIVVLFAEREGENTCAAFHPEAAVRTRLAPGWALVDFVPEGARGNPRQDLYLLRKPPLG